MSHRTKTAERTTRALPVLLAACLSALALAAPAQAAAGPSLAIKSTWSPTNLEPGGTGRFELQLQNLGEEAVHGSVQISDQLPPGVTITSLRWVEGFPAEQAETENRLGGSTVDYAHFCGGIDTETLSCSIPAEAIVLAEENEVFAVRAKPAERLTTPGEFSPEPLIVEVAVSPGAAAPASEANRATVTTSVQAATARQGSASANELQSLAVKATAGDFRLVSTTALGTGTLTAGSMVVTPVSTSFGKFHVGDKIFGHGIPRGAGTGDLASGSPTVSSVTGQFAAGEKIEGPGIPGGTEITACSPSCAAPSELTLSANATENKTAASLSAYTVVKAVISASKLELSTQATASGTSELTAIETTAEIPYNAPASGAGSVQAALNALPGIGFNVAVTGGPGDAAGASPYLVEFTGTLGNRDVPQLAALEGATPLSGGAVDFADQRQVPFDTATAPFGLVPGSLVGDFFDAAFPGGAPSRLAGDHPFELRVDFDLTRHLADLPPGANAPNALFPNGALSSVEYTLPRGAIFNPQATPKCTQAQFAAEECPADSQLGYLNAEIVYPGGSLEADKLEARHPFYNLEPPHGVPNDFGFNVAGLVQGHIYGQLDPAQEYALKGLTPNISALVPVKGSEVTFWGVPADPAHDRFRIYPGTTYAGAPWAGDPIRPLITNPMDCGAENGGGRMRLESYEEPGVFTPVAENPSPDNVKDCEDPRFRFEPGVELKPTDQHAGAPTGLKVDLKVPQREEEVKVKEAKELYAQNESIKGIGTPPIKKAVVTFPEGMTLNPSAAQGLGACTPAEIGLGTDSPVTCPDSSQYGTLTLHTPLLPEDNPPRGFIYIAKQGENPFGNFLSLYLVIEEPERGIRVKIPGRVELNHETGQITTTFDDLPQFPVSDMEMNLQGGVRAGLVNPSTCGKKVITAEFFTWQDPNTPHMVEDEYEISQKPDGSPCVGSLAERAFAPSLSAGTLNPRAGGYSPFVLHLTRTDEDQEFSQLGVKLPMGLAAKFAGVGICPDSGVAQALAREPVEGDGALEQADPSCPESSKIGTTMVGTGVGVPLSWVPGKVYLAGPYRGAPMSLVVISPAIVGPYDLGVVTVRTALNVNPETAQGEATSDPFPQIFQGIPVRIRDVRLNLNREGFTLNPTSCAEKQIEAKLTGTGNAVANLTNRFQAADCASLGFHPHLAFHLYGKTTRGGHPRFKAVVRMPRGGANISRAAVTLPHSEFLDQGHLNNVCTRVQFKARECPAASIYGYARAKTPLFEHPLEGPVYLRSSSHRLPDLVAALRGPASQPVEVDLDGRIDSVNGGIRNTFEVVPDASVETFTLTMRGGRKGLLENSENLCSGTFRANAVFGAQNGRRTVLHPRLAASCRHKRHR